MPVCFFCKGLVDPDARSTYRSIKGWEGKRSKGGANTIALREETGEYAHSACVSLERSDRRQHVIPGQMRFE
jgi:hypothetical protein